MWLGGERELWRWSTRISASAFQSWHGAGLPRNEALRGHGEVVRPGGGFGKAGAGRCSRRLSARQKKWAARLLSGPIGMKVKNLQRGTAHAAALGGVGRQRCISCNRYDAFLSIRQVGCSHVSHAFCAYRLKKQAFAIRRALVCPSRRHFRGFFCPRRFGLRGRWTGPAQKLQLRALEIRKSLNALSLAAFLISSA